MENEISQFKLNKVQKQKQNKMLIKLNKEIQYLENLKNNPEKISRKAKNAKNLKIFSGALRAYAPYVLVTAACLTVASSFNLTPFIRDSRKSYLNISKEFDSLGHTSSKRQYYEFEDDDAKIIHYGSWNKLADNTWQREIKTYNIGSVSEEMIRSIVEHKKVDMLSTIFGDPIFSTIELKNRLSKDEEETNGYIKAIIYDVDKNDFIMVSESILYDVLTTILFIFIDIFACGTTYVFKKFDFREYLENLEEQEIGIDYDSLVKILQIKKDNYNRLV